MSILPAVDAFRNTLGAINPNVPGTFPAGRREINWDGVPDAFAAPNLLPSNFFNVNSPRGVVFSTPGTGFQVSANLASGIPVEFGNINSLYPTLFAPFSPQRLFTPIASNVYDISFFVPGTTTPALTRGFGAIFSDVDLPNTTSIEFFGQDNASLGGFSAPSIPGNQSYSFVGFAFPTPVVSRVRIISGSASLSPGTMEGLPPDIVVADDFIYGEPVAAVPTADVSVTKIASASSVVVGEPFLYTITVTNNSTAPALNVQLTDIFPPGITLLEISTTSTFLLTPILPANRFTASSASFDGGASATFVARAIVNPSYDAGTISNTATVSAASPDPNMENNTSTSTVTVTPLLTDLSITKTTSSASVSPDGTLTYMISVTNTGNGTAENLTITDALPAGTTLQSVITPSGSSVTAPSLGQNGTITWQTPSLTKGATANYSATVRVDPLYNSITNTATVSSTTQDPDLSNNSSTVITTTCPTITVTIPNVMALPSGVLPNTVYTGYGPAASITLTADVSGGTGPYTFNWSTGSNDPSITVSPTETTTYSVSVTDANGCPGNTASITVTVTDIRSGKKGDKVLICHKPGKLNHTLSVGVNGVADHLAHGDLLGTCAPAAATTMRRFAGEEALFLPEKINLRTYPNPFVKTTHIQYALPVAAKVTIKLVDLLGREVGTVFNGSQTAGAYRIEYNSASLNRGVYYCQMIITANGKEYRQIQKVMKSD